MDPTGATKHPPGRPLGSWRALLPLGLGLVLAGCDLAPVYQRPAPAVAADWPGGPAYTARPGVPANRAEAEKAIPADDIGWHDFFVDPELQRLIAMALANNRDLRVATLTVASSEAQFRVQRAELFPFLDLTGVGDVQRYPASGIAPSGGTASPSGTNANAGGSAAAISGTSSTATGASTGGGTSAVSGSLSSSGSSGGSIIHYYDVGVGFTSYELDLFGRVRNLTRQAFEAYLASVENRRSAQISLVAQVASDYLTLLADREQLKLARDTLGSQQSSFGLTRAAFEAGTATALTLRQAESTVDTAQASVFQYTRQVAQDENALTLVVGVPAQAAASRQSTLDDQNILTDLPPGLPSVVLTRRPDVMAAEHQLLAANANIGTARAAFFPTISLTASYGTASTDLGSLFQGRSRTWNFIPSLSLPIFTGGENRANLDLAKTEKEIYLARYDQAIQTAFREVADALAARRTLDDQIRAIDALVNANADAYQLADMRFRAGVDAFLTTLDAQRALFSAQQQLITLKQSRLNNLVTLYKALGGGWREHGAVQTATK